MEEQATSADERARQEELDRFIEAVKVGEDQLDRGEYLTHEEVGKRLKRFLER